MTTQEVVRMTARVVGWEKYLEIPFTKRLFFVKKSKSIFDRLGNNKFGLQQWFYICEDNFWCGKVKSRG
jgi:hypothetical protein